MMGSDFFTSNFWKPLQSFLKFFQQVLIAHWRSLLVLLLGIYLPLQVFEFLAVQVWQHQAGLPWDAPIMLAIHSTAQPQLDRFVLLLTNLGSARTGVPIFGAIALVLFLGKHWRKAIFVLTAGCGSAIINFTAKRLMHRVRPHLWDSIYHHAGYAFPSGHAMTTMSLIVVLLILTWKTRWRLPVLMIGSLYVLTIGWTRLYLGFHFPSDILAGWMVALAWVLGVSLIIKPNAILSVNPQQSAAESAETALLPEEIQ